MKCVIKRAARDIFAVPMTMIVRAFTALLGASACLALALTTAFLPAGLLSGCGPVDGRDELAHVGPLDQVPFAVTDFFTPSGQMGDGAKPDFLTVTSGDTCKSRTGLARGRCYNFHYRPGSVLWAGSYWAYPSNNWGSETGRKFKPWLMRDVVDAQGVTTRQLTQRYNYVTFSAAAERDTFKIKLSGTDSASKTYTLRNAVFTVDGPTHEQIVVDNYLNLDPLGMMGLPAPLSSTPRASNPNALLTVKPGAYTISLQPGWSLVAPNTMGQFEEVPGATLAVSSTSFTIAPGVDAVAGFDFTVGAETVHFDLRNPPTAVKFFVGKIKDAFLVTVTCPDPTQTCEHKDFISTAEPTFDLLRSWQAFSIKLTIDPPCVSSLDAGGMVQTSKFADSKTGVVACAPGTLNADGYVANCPPGKPGILSADQQTITCCEEQLLSGVCNAASSPGSWVRADDLIQTVIGGFGWATSYGEFEAQNAVLAGAMGPAAGSTNLNEQQRATLPSTTVYLDDIVWDFVVMP